MILSKQSNKQKETAQAATCTASRLRQMFRASAKTYVVIGLL